MAMSTLTQSLIGRIALHVAAAIVDHQWAWHVAGIRKELV